MTSPLAELVNDGQLPNVARIADTAPAAGHPDVVNATQELIERLEASLTPPSPKGEQQWYGWLPLRLKEFYEGMLIARQALGPGNHRFLEIGSGIGSKLCLAHALGWDACGIERHPPYAEASKRVFPHCPVITANAEDFTILYGQQDLVYCYGIATSPERQHDINRHITGHMKSGALYFFAFPSHLRLDWLEHLAGRVWRKP